MLTADRLTFTYPRAASPAVRGLSFAIEKGEIFGFLGPNGSGKTTTQRILTGLQHGYGGSVEVFGQALAALGPDYYNRIGVCFEQPNLYEQLTAEENLSFYAGLFDVPTERPADLLRSLDLPVGDRRTAGQFSKGMKMRLALARSLLNRPQVWFLDEPTAGQDPGHSVAIRQLIAAQRDRGTTVFLTTHNMTVADELCDRVALLVDGRIAAMDTPRRLKLEHARRLVRVEYRPREGSDAIVSAEFALDEPRAKAEFLTLVRDHEVETIHTTEPTLEEVFLRLTGSRLLAGGSQ